MEDREMNERKLKLPFGNFRRRVHSKGGGEDVIERLSLYLFAFPLQTWSRAEITKLPRVKCLCLSTYCF